MADTRAPRLAVLIDADNASARIAQGLFEEIAKIGEASVRRIYGDFSNAQLGGWAKVLAMYAIQPQHTIAAVAGKNASDIALVIDAMDLLHTGRFDAFCLVSSDSDFTRLAARIREQGVDVYGFGEQKTPESFRQACRRFIYTENLLPPPAPVAKPSGTKAANGKSAATTAPAKVLKPPAEAMRLIRTALAQLDDSEGWVSLGVLGKRLLELASDFDPRSYGHGKLVDLVTRTGGFEVDRPKTGGVYVRDMA